MRHVEWLERFDRFDAAATGWFLRIFGLALIVDVATEIAAGVWSVHTGRFWPWHHIELMPLYSTGALSLEWLARGLAGLALAVGAHRATVVAAAVRIAAVALFVALLQRFSNHGSLLFIMALFLSLAPPRVAASSFYKVDHPALGLVRAQLVIVYGFSFLSKLTHGFASGHSLSNLLGGRLSLEHARPLSWLVMATELAIPWVLLRSPRWGIAVVATMHLTFAAFVPGVASFGLAMVAMAVLFVGTGRTSKPATVTP
jgi:hypothetical protein